MKIAFWANVTISLDLYAIKDGSAVETFGPKVGWRLRLSRIGAGLNARGFQLFNPTH